MVAAHRTIWPHVVRPPARAGAWRSPTKDFRLPRLPARNGTIRRLFCAAIRKPPGRFCPAAVRFRSGRYSGMPIWRGRTARLQRMGPTAFTAARSRGRLVAGLERRGAMMTAADLSEFRAQWADPISTNYRGWEVFELPPNGAGIAALMMLNILEAFSLRRGTGVSGCASCNDRGEEAGVRRHAATRRRS